MDRVIGIIDQMDVPLSAAVCLAMLVIDPSESLISWSEIGRNFALVLAALVIAPITLYFQHKRIEIGGDQRDIDSRRLSIDTYIKNLGMFGSGPPSLRIAALHGLRRIAIDEQNHRQQIMAFLCFHIREQKPWPAVHRPAPENLEDRKSENNCIVIQEILTVLGEKTVARGGQDKELNLRRTDLRGLSMKGCIFNKADFEESNLEAAEFHCAQLNGANFKNARLKGAYLQEAQLSSANLSGACLQEAFLIDTNIFNGSLLSANLTGASLRDADLTRADLSDACLENADLRKASLKDARLWNANLKGANLEDADLTGAQLMDADLSGACLKNAIFREHPRTSGARWDPGTEPPGMDTIQVGQDSN